MLRCRTASAKRARPSGVIPRLTVFFFAGGGALGFAAAAFCCRSSARRLFESAIRFRPSGLIRMLAGPAFG
jgi:hypothetical protein